MRIERRYTKQGQSPYAGIEFRLTTSEIRNPDGSVVFHQDDIEGKWYAIVTHAERDVHESANLLPDSMAMRLWLSLVPGYSLIYANDTIRVFERVATAVEIEEQQKTETGNTIE